MSQTQCYCYKSDEEESTALPDYEEIMLATEASAAAVAPPMPEIPPSTPIFPVYLQGSAELNVDLFETPPRPIRQTLVPNAPRKQWVVPEGEPQPEPLPEPKSRRVNRQEYPYTVFARNSYCPGRIARYTLSIKSGGLAELETQTWSGIYRKFRFWLPHVNVTYLEVDAQGWPRAVIEMNHSDPIKLLFETEEEADECGEYLFNAIGR